MRITTGNCKKKLLRQIANGGGFFHFFNLLNGHGSNVTTQHPTGFKMYYANVFIYLRRIASWTCFFEIPPRQKFFKSLINWKSLKSFLLSVAIQ